MQQNRVTDHQARVAAAVAETDDTPTRPTRMFRTLPMSEDYALGQLRHLYQLMVQGHVRDLAHAARHILGPAIEGLETAQAARLIHRGEAAP